MKIPYVAIDLAWQNTVLAKSVTKVSGGTVHVLYTLGLHKVTLVLWEV